jgi:hypothetical protein
VPWLQTNPPYVSVRARRQAAPARGQGAQQYISVLALGTHENLVGGASNNYIMQAVTCMERELCVLSVTDVQHCQVSQDSEAN